MCMFAVHISNIELKSCMNLTLATFRLDYEYDIDYEYERLDTSSSNSPPHPGKVQIPHPGKALIKFPTPLARKIVKCQGLPGGC